MRGLTIGGFVAGLCCAIAATAPNDEVGDRAAAIRATAEAIARECQTYGGGDWAAWHARLADFRADLSKRIETAIPKLPAVKADPAAAPSALLRVNGSPPIFEFPIYAQYLVADQDPETWAHDRPASATFIAVSRWLKAKNIDLLVVPTPRIPEVYPDKLAAGVPPERIVSPPLRRLVLELLRADVEVVDLLPLLLKARTENPEPLYLASDGHWSDRAQHIAAAEIARRLKRYAVVQSALRQPRLFRSEPVTVGFRGSIFEYLTASERHEVDDATSNMPVTKVTTTAGTAFEEPDQSPVLVIGDSLTHYFQHMVLRGSGIDALLSQEINIPVSNVSSAGGTIAPIKDILRRPELLQGRRVVVWILNNALLSYPASQWELPPLPK